MKDTHDKFFKSFPEVDKDWTEADWKRLVDHLIETKILTWKEVAAFLLGSLNPSQVGTSIASKKSFQCHFEPRKCWEAVRRWHFDQSGKCADCGSRLDLQADHMVPRQELGDDADRLENMTLRCRRCNVIRRPSHKHGGKTYLSTESALMWLLFIKRPTTYQEFAKICREYGLTMASIRFEEAWAMARWLARDGLYTIARESTF